jgi:hypothetical protein
LCLFRIDEKALRSENVIKEVEATMLKGTSIQIIWKTLLANVFDACPLHITYI